MVETREGVAQGEELVKEMEEVGRGLTSLISNERIYAIVGDERLLKDRQTTKAALAEDVLQLRAVTRDNPNQQRRLDRLEPLIAQCIDWDERVIAARRQEGSPAAAKIIGPGPHLVL